MASELYMKTIAYYMKFFIYDDYISIIGGLYLSLAK